MSPKAMTKPRAATAAKATRTPAKSATAKTAKPPKAPAPRMSVAQAMSALEGAGTAQARKIYARHGVTMPTFGVSFATLKDLAKKIKVDHELACALWDTGNFDARNLAYKIVEPSKLSSTDLDRWAKETTVRMCGGYVPEIVTESGAGRAKAEKWLAASGDSLPCAGWGVVSSMAMRDETTPDDWFAKRLGEIENAIHGASNAQRLAMNGAVIAIGCRNPSLKKAALASAKRIGRVEVDHGDTECKTADAAQSIEKAWSHSTSKGFASPAAHERSRAPMRVRC